MAVNEEEMLSKGMTDTGRRTHGGDMSDKNLCIAAEAFRTAGDSRRKVEIGRSILEIMIEMIEMSYERDTTQSKLELDGHFGILRRKIAMKKPK